MQEKMECDWFKPSKHEVIHFRSFTNIQLQHSQQNLNLKSTKPKIVTTKIIVFFDSCKQNARNAQWNAFKMKNVSNTD